MVCPRIMFYLGACQKCYGALVADEDMFRCLHCGCRYYPDRGSVEEPVDRLDSKIYDREYHRRWRAEQKAKGGKFIHGRLVFD